MLRIRLRSDRDDAEASAAEIADIVDDLKVVRHSLDTMGPIYELDASVEEAVRELNFNRLSIECLATPDGSTFVEIDSP